MFNVTIRSPLPLVLKRIPLPFFFFLCVCMCVSVVKSIQKKTNKKERMKSIPIEVSQKGMDEERKESKNRKRDTLVNRCLPPARRIRRLTAEATDIREKVKISPSIRFVSQNSKQVGTRSMTCGEKHFAMEKRTCFSHCSCYSEKELTVE